MITLLKEHALSETETWTASEETDGWTTALKKQQQNPNQQTQKM